VVYFYGAYARQELLLLRDLLKDRADPVCVDVGANVGQHSLFMSRYCKEVHAFEPYPPVRKQLESKITRNRIHNIVVHDVGIGERAGELDFYGPAGANAGTGSFVPSHAVDNNRWIGRLTVVNGDEYFSRLGLQKIDLMKIDVEGFERSVLRGLCRTLRTWRPVVVMEFSEDTRRSFSGEDEFLAMLPDRYRVKHITSNKVFAVFFNRVEYKCADFNFNTSRGNLLLAPE
jgi:FkbM family methyltransferase